jgi:transcriptional regulator with PAS, ATPase and Fis domain
VVVAAKKGGIGKMVLANGGTLFLDEIGDMPLHLQARLLRALQERAVSPLGSNKLIQVDVTVVCATHRNMREMVASGQFREDLYYRLNGLVVRLPALRERTDLDVVADKLLKLEQADAPPISEAVMQKFRSYHWPGNIRQLGQFVARVRDVTGKPVGVKFVAVDDDAGHRFTVAAHQLSRMMRVYPAASQQRGR